MEMLLVDFENELRYTFERLNVVKLDSLVKMESFKYFVGLEEYVEGRIIKLPLSKYKSVAKCSSFDYAINLRKKINLPRFDGEIAYGGLSELVFTACGNSKLKIAIITEFELLPKIDIEGLRKLFDRYEYVYTINEEIFKLLNSMENVYYFNELKLIENEICEIVKKYCK